MTQKTLSGSGLFGRAAASGILAGFLGFAVVTDEAFAANDGIVRRGNVTFERNGNTTIIRASDGSIIEYVNFNILAHETVRFIQPNELSRVLNRITGGTPTIIQGRLLANGQVYLVNPAGVMFSNTAVINVGGLYAAAGNISNSNFTNGVDRFTGLTGDVVNDGVIRGSQIHLLGRHVANHGLIRADAGVITLIAGNDVLLRQLGERITVRVDGDWLTNNSGPRSGSTAPNLTATPGVENTGIITSSQGQVFLGAGDMYSLAIKNSGTVRAESGDIRLAAKDGAVHITDTGLLTTFGTDARDSRITVQAPSIVHQGTINASTVNGRAGSIEVTSANHTYLLGGSLIRASGSRGVADGGNVLVHSYDGLTVFANGAQIDVRGGRMGGAGGFVEVSGEMLVFNGDVLLQGALGSAAGNLLIDPQDITITQNGTDDALLNDGVITFNEPDEFTDISISAAALEAIVGDILLQATRDIFINHQVNLVNNNNITFEARRHIELNAAINGANNLLLLADVDLNGTGIVRIGVPVSVNGLARFQGAGIELGGGTITTGSSLEIIGPVVLLTNTTINGPGVVFNGRLNAQAPGAQNLIVNGKATFQQEVGLTTLLGSVRVVGVTAMNGGFIGTTGQQQYIGASLLGSSMILQGQVIQLGGTVDAVDPGVQSLSIAGTAIFEGAVGNTGALHNLKVAGKTSIDTSSIITTGEQRYQDVVSIRQNTTLTSGTVIFDKAVDGLTAGDQSLSIIGDVTFSDRVGDQIALNSLTVDGLAFINTGFITTTGLQSYLGDVVLGASAQFLGSSIHFGARLDAAVAGGQSAKILGDAVFGGEVGGLQALDSLSVSGRTDLNGGLVRTTGLQQYLGETVLGADNVLEGSRVQFFGTLDGAHNLTINGGADFNGMVGDGTALNTLTVNGDTVIAGGLVRTTGNLTFAGPVVLANNATLETFTGDLTIAGTLDGAFSANLRAGGNVSLGASVGSIDALASLDIEAGERILLAGPLVRTTGNMSFDTNRAGGIPNAATIIGLGDLTLESLSGDITMSQNEKLTVLGALVINAVTGAATLSDISTLGDLTVNASEIYILLRAGGPVLLADGTIVNDSGVDFVSGGNISFSSTPTLLGTGEGPRFASAGGNADVTGTLGAFEQVTIDALSLADFTYNGMVLDLMVAASDNGGEPPVPPTPPVVDVDPPNGLAEALGDDPELPGDADGLGNALLVDPLVRQELANMGIVLRDLDIDRDTVAGLRVINDLPSGIAPENVAVVNVHRVNRRAIANALIAARALSLNTDDTAAVSRTRDDIAHSFSTYRASGAQTTFATWAKSSNDASATALADLWRNLRNSGLNHRELDLVAARVLDPVRPAGVNRDAFIQMLGSGG